MVPIYMGPFFLYLLIYFVSFLYSTCMWNQMDLSLSDLCHLAKYHPGPSMSSQMARFIIFYCWEALCVGTAKSCQLPAFLGVGHRHVCMQQCPPSSQLSLTRQRCVQELPCVASSMLSAGRWAPHPCAVQVVKQHPAISARSVSRWKLPLITACGVLLFQLDLPGGVDEDAP